MNPEDTNQLRTLLMDLVPKDGTSIGNVTLLEQFKTQAKTRLKLSTSDNDYWEVRNGLISEGDLAKGRGRGGSVYLVDPQQEKKSIQGKVRKKGRESYLYAPVYKILGETWVKENGIRDFVIQNTASQGAKKTGGKWTRPDVSLIAVKLYPFIPGKILEVITFEIKNENEIGIEGVFESAAHSVFGHKCYLVIHLPDGKPDSEDFDRLGRECERFGIGLLSFVDPADFSTYEELVSPERKNPDPADVNSFIATQINKDNQERLHQLLR